MSAEVSAGGVLISSMLPCVGAALLLLAVVRVLLGRSGLYRRIWHPALFDAALFVIFWAGLVQLWFKST